MTKYQITQTETHVTEATTEAEALEAWHAGKIDGSGAVSLTIVNVEDRAEDLHTFTFLSGETYDVKASTLAEARRRLDDYLSGESFEHVEDGETLTELIARPCLECPPDSRGWHKGDDAGITFEGLKIAQNESFIAGIELARDYLEDVNYHTGANVVADLLAILDGKQIFPEWQLDFFAKREHSLYSTECEGAN
jgi:hypothetical protein